MSNQSSGFLLVTGATGFLGGAVISALVVQPRWATVLLLVRGATPGEGRRRIVESLRRFSVPEHLCDRVLESQIICGDLCSVPSFANDSRLSAVTDVVNCAAVAGFGAPKTLWPTNVDGTLAFAHVLNERATLRRFIHVGTAMSCGLPAPHVVPEDYQAPADAEHLVPYTESKIECEHRLRAELPGMPLIVARPSIIVGDTRFGCEPSPSIFWVFRMARALGKFTCSLDDKVDVVPADYCADAILHLLDCAELSHDLYHISAGEKLSAKFRDIDAAIAAGLGQPPTADYEQVEYEDLAARHREFQELFGPCIVPVMLRAIELYGEYSSLNMCFANDRLMAAGMRPPPAFTAYAGLCARTAEALTIAEQMQYDFKGISTRAANALRGMLRTSASAVADLPRKAAA
jgi:nucleoside-diphosphate-sugar epimerase